MPERNLSPGEQIAADLAELQARMSAEKKAFQAEYDAAKAPIDQRKKEDEVWELAQQKMYIFNSQISLSPGEAQRRREPLMPQEWKDAVGYVRRHFHSEADSDRRHIYDQAEGKLMGLRLHPSDAEIIKKVVAIRGEVGDKLSALEKSRAAEAIPAPGLKKSRPVSAGQFAAAIGGTHFVDSGVAEIEAD